MPSLIVGQRDTKVISFDNKARDIEQDIIEIQPNRAPFTSFLQALKSVPTKRTQFEHGEHDVIPGKVTVSGGQSDVDTTIELGVGTTARVPLNSILWNTRTDEVVRATGRDTGADTLTVTRGFAGTTNLAMNNTDTLVIIEAYEEGVEFSEGVSNEAELKNNYIQEIETEVSMSWFQMAEAELTQGDWPYQVEQKIIYHKEKQERQFLFGRKNLTASGPQGHRVFYSGGLYEMITSDSGNAKTVTGVLDKDTIDVWLANIYSYGNPNRKILFTSPLGWLSLTRLSEGYQTVQRSEKTLGMTINKVEINGHMFTVVENQMFHALGMDNLIVCADMDHVIKRHFQYNGMNFSTKWHEDVQTNAAKGKRNVLYSVEGLQRRNANAHGYIKGFTVPTIQS